MFCRFGLMLASRPGRGVGLQERRVQPAVVADPGRQRVEVGLHELGQLAPALDLGDDLVLVADRLQHAGVGREAGLAAALARQAELDEQHLGELLRRADHELLARQVPDLALELLGVDPDRARGLLQPPRVELDADLLGLPQDVHERDLDVGQQVGQPALLERRALQRREVVDEHRAGRLLVVGGARPGRAPRTARRAGSRGGRGRAGRRRARCRRRGSAGRRRAPWRRARRRAGRRRRATSSAGSSTSPASA